MAGIGPNKRPTSLIFQNLALFPLMSVADNIAFSLEVRGTGKAQRRKRADELLELVALSGQGDKKVNELSGGQKQRVAIARALAIEPAVLLLDEPSLGLAPKIVSQIFEIIQTLKDEKRTILLVEQNATQALRLSDYAYFLNNGHIVAEGHPDALGGREDLMAELTGIV